MASKPHHETQAIFQLHSLGTLLCLRNVDANENGLEETGIVSSALSKKDSRHQVVWLHHECWSLHQIGSTEYPVDCSPAPSFSVRPHCAYMPDNVPAKAVLRVASDVRDGVPPFPNWHRLRGRPPITWLHQICSDCGLSAGVALAYCAQDRIVWRTYATASSALHWRRRHLSLAMSVALPRTEQMRLCSSFIARLTYAVSEWRGFIKASDHQRINSVDFLPIA